MQTSNKNGMKSPCFLCREKTDLSFDRVKFSKKNMGHLGVSIVIDLNPSQKGRGVTRLCHMLLYELANS